MICVVPVAPDVAFDPISTEIHRLAAIVSVPEVIVIICPDCPTPHVAPDGDVEIVLSENEVQVPPDETARSTLFMLNVPIVNCAGNVMVIVPAAATPVGVMKLIVWFASVFILTVESASETLVSEAASANCGPNDIKNIPIRRKLVVKNFIGN